MGISSVAFPARHSSPATQILVSTLLVNLGGYGLIRFGLSLFPLAAISFAPAMIIVGLAGFLYGAVAAGACPLLSGTLSYWTMSQMGLALIGLFSMQNLGLHGTIMSLIGRGLGIAALLILAESRTQPGNNATLAATSVAFLSLIGVPGLAGFIGQSALVMGILRWHWRANTSAAADSLFDWGLYSAVALGLAVGMWALYGAWRRLWRDLSAVPTQAAPSLQTLIALPVLIVLLIVGLYPRFFANMVGPSVHQLLNDVAVGVQNSLIGTQPR
jgi:NADH-quinone oxidoreductase subunit M